MDRTIKSVGFRAPHSVAILTSDTPDELKEGQFFVKTLYTGVSAGTELTFFMGTNPKTSEGWDAEHRLFRGDIEPDQSEIYPMVKGYMAVGEVIESRSDKVKVGQRVAMRYGHHSGYVAHDNEFFYVLPDDLDPQLGTLVAQMGPICMNGILFAADDLQRNEIVSLEHSLRDQRVMVFGAGMVGLLVGMFAQWAGASEVGIVDGIAERLDIAESLGMVPYDTVTGDLPTTIKEHWKREPNDTGADIVFQCTGSDYLLSLALACLREQGTVIDLGFYQQGANQVNLGKDFHHNVLRHICAQIGSQPRHQPAWNRHRLSDETVSFLRSHGEKLKQVAFTHDAHYSEAQAIYDALANRDHSLMQVIFKYAD